MYTRRHQKRACPLLSCMDPLSFPLEYHPFFQFFFDPCAKSHFFIFKVFFHSIFGVSLNHGVWPGCAHVLHGTFVPRRWTLTTYVDARTLREKGPAPMDVDGLDAVKKKKRRSGLKGAPRTPNQEMTKVDGESYSEWKKRDTGTLSVQRSFKDTERGQGKSNRGNGQSTHKKKEIQINNNGQTSCIGPDNVHSLH